MLNRIKIAKPRKSGRLQAHLAYKKVMHSISYRNGRHFVPFSQIATIEDTVGKEIHALLVNLEDGAVESGMPVYRNLILQIDSWLAQFNTLEEASRAVSIFRLSTGELQDELAKSHFFSLLHGMFFIYDDPKVAEPLGIEPIPAWHSWVPKLTAATNPWEPVNFDTAIEEFSKRQVLTRAEFDLLEAHAKRHAFTAAGMSARTITDRLKPAIQSALQNGDTLHEFRKALKDVNLTRAHAETIFRTNVQTAYTNGHMEAILDPRMQGIIVGARFINPGDNRTTDQCMERIGEEYSTSDLATLDVVPPLHYRCRSTLRRLFADEMKGKTFSDPPKIPADSGFGRYRPILPNRTVTQTAPTVPNAPAKKIFGKEAGTKEEFLEMVPHYTDDVGKKMSEIASLTDELGAEHSITVTDLSTITEIQSGNGNSVWIKRYFDEINDQVKSFTTIHTHPSGRTTFSPEDIVNGFFNKREEVSVVISGDKVAVLDSSAIKLSRVEYEAMADELYSGFAELYPGVRPANAANLYNNYIADFFEDIGVDYGIFERSTIGF